MADETRSAASGLRDDVAAYRANGTVITDETLRDWERRLTALAFPVNPPELRVTWHDHEPKPGEGRDDLRLLLNRGDWSVPWVRREIAALFEDAASWKKVAREYEAALSDRGLL